MQLFSSRICLPGNTVEQSWCYKNGGRAIKCEQ